MTVPQPIGAFPTLADKGGKRMARIGKYGGKTLPSQTTDISPQKALTMLREGTARGKPLTPKQRGFLGAVAGKSKKR